MLNNFHKCLPKDQTIFEYVQYYKPIPYQPLRKAASLDSKSKSSIPELHVTTNNLDKFKYTSYIYEPKYFDIIERSDQLQMLLNYV